MNYVHSINSLCGGHEAMDTLYLQFLHGSYNTLNHSYTNEDLHHIATVQAQPLSPDMCVYVTC